VSRHNHTASHSNSGRTSAGKRAHTRRHLGRCSASQKVRFRDKREALEAVHAAGTSRRFAEADGVVSARQERRTYHCSSCRGWHLTSRESWSDERPVLPRTQGRSGVTIDKASGLLQVLRAVRSTDAESAGSIADHPGDIDRPRLQPAWPPVPAIPPSPFKEELRSAL
jgi:hypothetical protein